MCSILRLWSTSSRRLSYLHLIGHSLGGILRCLLGLYPDRVRKAVSRSKAWDLPLRIAFTSLRRSGCAPGSKPSAEAEKREPRSYPNLEAAVTRMKEANPHLSDEVARHLTLHGTNWNADGSLIWKFDNYVRDAALWAWY